MFNFFKFNFLLQIRVLKQLSSDPYTTIRRVNWSHHIIHSSVRLLCAKKPNNSFLDKSNNKGWDFDAIAHFLTMF